ncbi:autotransporter outer membrane beta-barrel domain-containing protein [Buttiauxella ferragutiae]|uniref:autotransporter outer membrane beta-barrel domain-containing protein n=1 Tax=Buttiauxella ferragutiae TaxID=82989 RepID=UPI001F5383EB|nr:autotransporter outer membrane beta-barrel domain-containing protein [Buttiauxella ferragutiae]UNK61500.1 autotransporter outer membrane beta-barrel domain-containing protein [Buttiauxella ferragutiae]
MNTVYRIIWSVAKQCWMAVSELTKGRSKSSRSKTGPGVVVLAMFALSGTVHASTVTWSPTGQGSGGSGTWNVIDSEWFNGTVMLPWNNLAGDSALFGGTAGTITVTNPITVQDLLFNVNGYIINGGTLSTASGTMGINVGSGNTATVNSIIAGTGRVDINGGGILVLGGTNTYSGGTTITNNSTLRVSSDSSLGAAAGLLTLGNLSSLGTLAITGGPFISTRNVALAQGGGIINVASGATATVGGVMSGTGALTLNGAGTLILTGANTNTGTTTVSSGTLQIGNGGTTGVLGSSVVTNNGTLTFNRSNSYTYAGAISGTGQLVQSGSGTTILTGANTYSGGTTINAGTLQIGGGGATGSITGNITNNGLLSFSHNNTYTQAGVISGSGAVQQNGGTTILSGINTYTGETQIKSGTLQVDSDNNLGASSSQIHFTGGGNFLANSSFTTARNVVIDSGFNSYLGSANANAPLTLNGVVSGAGALGVYAGNVILTGANTYTGGTNIWGGYLSVSNDANLGAATGSVNFINGGTLRLLSDFTTSRNVVLSNNGTFETFNGTSLTLNGTISGGGWLLLTSAGSPGGTVYLNGTNTYTNTTYLQGGVKAIVSNAAALGSGKDVNIGNGTLVVTGSYAINRIGLNTGGVTVDVAPNMTLTVNNDIYGSNSALRKTNTGTLVLAGTSSSTSGFNIAEGTLQVGNGGASGSLGTGNVVNSSSLVFNRSDAYSYAGAISGTGTLTQNGSGSTTLSGNSTYTGTTRVAAGSLYINGNQTNATGATTVESGATLGGAGTIGGDVTIANGGILAPGASDSAAGTLTIRRNLLLSGGSILNYNLGQSDVVGGQYNDQTVVGGNLTLDGTLNVNTTAGGTFGAGVYRIISYTGTLTDNGLAIGSMPAGSNTELQTSVNGQVNLVNSLGNMRYWDVAQNNGAVNGGTGIWNSGAGANSNWSNAAGTTNGVYSQGYAAFMGTPGTVTVDDSLGAVTSEGMQFATNGYTVAGDAINLSETTPGSGQTTIRVGDGTTAGSNYVATVGSVLQGSTAVTKTDRGTLILTGANTYTGGTTVSAGTLQLGNGGTSGSIIGDVLNNSALVFNRSDTATFGGVISSTGIVNQIGSGTTILTGANSYSGTTTISSGTLQVGNGGTTGTLGTGGVTVTTPGGLVFKRSNTVTFGGVISGTGSVAQSGTGTTILTNNNNYSGGTTINAGTLQLGNSGGAGSVTGNIVNNSKLLFNRNASYTYAGVISGSGSVEQRVGSLTLSGANTYTGDTLMSGSGTNRLYVSSDANLGASSSRLRFTGNTATAWLIANTATTLARDVIIDAGSQGSFGSAGWSTPLTLSGNISGGGLLGARQGSVYLTGNSTYTGGTYINNAILGVTSDASMGAVSGGLTMDNGAVLQALNSLSIARNISTANTGGTIQTINGATLTLSGSISGGGALRYNNSGSGSGTIIIAGNASPNGTYVNGVTLQIGNGGTTGAVSGNISNSGTVVFNRSDTANYGNAIFGSGGVIQNGTGTTTLSGANTYTGGTTITTGTLQLGNGGASGSVTGNIINNSNLAFKRSDVYTYDGTITGSGTIHQSGTGTTILTGTNTNAGDTTIDSGTLQIGNGGTTGSITDNVINNGTLAFNRSDTVNFTGTISGTGGLQKNGAGYTYLTGNNSYTGATTVSTGGLIVNGDQSAATGATTVAANAVLGGTGTIGGNVTIANDAILAPGSTNGTGGTLTVKGNLALNGTSILRYTFGSVNGVAQNSLTNVRGNLTLDGRLDVTIPTGGTFDPGIYRIFNYDGTLTNNGLALGNMPPSTTVALQTGVPGQINLINTTGILTAVWDGSNPTKYNNGAADGGSGVWNRNLANQSWGDASSSINSTYTPTSFVIFQGTPATVTVDNTYGSISTTGLQFAVSGYSLVGGTIDLLETSSGTNSTTIRVGDGSDTGAGYTATIGSVLQGSTGITKTDKGKLILTGSNTYSGGTTMNNGTLNVSSDSNLGAAAGALAFNGGTLESSGTFSTARTTTLNTKGGTLDVDTGKTLTLSGVISGVGKLTKTDAGKLVLSGANTYSGGTEISAGTVSVASDSALGAADGVLTIDNATLETSASMTSTRTTMLNAAGATLNVDDGTTLTLNGIIEGSGALNKSGTGTLALAGTSTYSGGTVFNAGKIQVSSDASLGAASGALTFNGGSLETTTTMASDRTATIDAGSATFDVDTGTTLTMNGVISGAGALHKADAGTLLLTTANTYSGGTAIAGGLLKLTNADAAGTGTVNINTATGLELAFASASTFDNQLAGAGTTTVNGAQTTVTADNSAYTGNWNVTSSSTLAVANTATSSTTNLGTGAVDIATDGIVNTQTTGAFSFNNALTGSGTLDASNNGQALSFGSGVGANFAGTVNLADNSFALSGDNTTALTRATLNMNAGNVTTVGAGSQAIGNLTFNGGTMLFSNLPSGTVATNALALTTGNVQLDTQDAGTSGNLLVQDEGTTRQLISATSVTGSEGNLVLKDLAGNVLTTGTSNIVQGGNTVAVGSYSYGLATRAAGSSTVDGLYAAYRLSQLALQAGQTLMLAQSNGANGTSADMSAKLTGSGSLQIDAGNGVVSLSNATNDYSGETSVTTGTLQAGSDNALGHTSKLNLADTTTFDLNAKTQTLGALNGLAGSTLNINNGTLNLSNGGTLAGSLTGAGQLNVNGGTLDVQGENTGLTAATAIVSGATVKINHVDSLGSSVITAAGTLVVDAAIGSLDNVINGAGAVQLSNAADVTLAGNSALSGSWNTDAGTRLTATQAANLGTAAINNAGTFNVDTATDWTLDNAINGAGTVTKNGTGTLTLARANSYSGNTTISGGVLKLTNADGAGTGVVNIDTVAGLELALATASVFDNQLAGAGATTVSGAQATITANNSAYTGNWNVTSSGTLAVPDSATSSTPNLGSGAVDIAAGGIVNAQTTGAFSFDNALTGAGTLNASNNGNTFSFGSGVGANFAGTANLTHNTFDLTGDNTSALTRATLEVGTGNVTTVGDGNQQIGGLTINGGRMQFNATAPEQILATSHITAGTLEINHTGTVRLNLPTPFTPAPPDTPNTTNLLKQDEENVSVQLVIASSVTGSGGAIELTDQNGDVITAARQIDISQNGNTVAQATYDYRLTSSSQNDGLYVNYGLKQLDLQANQTLTLAQDTGASGVAADMSAKITGSGNLAINARSDVLSLSNALNDYSGETSVSSGTLQSGSDNALGNTSKLNLADTTTFDLNAKTQTIGALNGLAGSTLNINNGSLNLSNGGTSAGSLTGTGQLNVNGGTLDVQGENTGLTATTAIASGATVKINHVDSLGSSVITTAGTLVVDAATGSLDNVINGAGAVKLSNAADVTLAGNSALSGSWNTDAGTRLTATQAANLGTAAINNAGTFNVDTATDWTLDNAINGAGAVTKNGTGTLTFARANSYSGNTTISGGVLKLTDADGAGTGVVNIDTAAGLELALATASVFDNQLAGAGATTVSGAQATITADNSAYTGNWNVTGSGTLAVDSTATSSTPNLGSGAVDIAAGGIVNAQTSGAFSFDNALTGAGTLNASSGGNAFSFGSGVGANFAGTANLTDNTFDLTGDNTTALTRATLQVGTGNVTTVGDGDQQIGGLTLNGGTMKFNATAPDQSVATSLITAGALDINRTGTVMVKLPEPLTASAPDTPNATNLLMQDEGETGVQLVRSGAVTGSGGALELVDQNGEKITAAREIDVSQDGNTVAKATYDYRLTSGAQSNGLYVNYGLKQLDLQADQTLTLTQDTAANGASADMSAKITGSGNLAIDARGGLLSLTNITNDYRGETSVNSGTLQAGSDNALGQTSKLNLASASAFDLNGKTQTLGALNGETGSTLNLNGGTLDLSNGGTSAGTLAGGGKLNVNGGTLDVQGANNGLTAATTVAAGATVSLNHVDGLGSSEITSTGKLVLDGATGTMDNTIKGTGEVVKRGAGEVVMTGKTDWTGNTLIDEGELTLDGSQGGAQLVSNIIAKDNTALSLRNGASLTGWIDPTDVNIDSASTWNMTADSLVDDVNLAGTLNYVAPGSMPMAAGRTLTANNWNGQGGTLVLNTVLGGDNSVTDKLLVNGNTSGNTFMKVNNAGGSGAQTVEGIRVVEVKGQSDGTFTKSGRIVAGAYDYSLVKKGADWFLTSLDTTAKPPEPAKPGEPSPEPEKKGQPTVRPEAAAYTANLAAANTMFITSLHDRLGETQYTDALTGEQKVTSMWLRQLGGQNRWKDSSGQIETQSNRYVTQLGGDIAQWSPDGLQRLHLGVMAGYGTSSSKSRSNVTGYRAEGSVDGYSAGLYATWYQNDETRQGAYVDSWAQYGWFNNEVNGQDIKGESYKSSGITASLEMGYTHKLGEFAGSQGSLNEWFIQPQAQAIWMGVEADDHRESNGTRVSGEGDGNVQTRLGVRTYLKGHNKIDDGKGRTFQPFVEVNWIHNTQSFGTRMDGVSLTQSGARNIGEIKTGVEGQLNSRLNLWGNVGVQVGDKGYSDASAMVGVKYSF